MKQYKGYLIDLDGTMYRGNELIEGAAEFVAALDHKQIPYLFVTNNSSMTQTAVSDKLNKMGILSTPDHVFTSSMATANYIQARQEHARCYVIGEAGLQHALEQKDLIIATDACDFVVAGIDRAISYEKLSAACLEIRRGAYFISTNSDVALPTERGLEPGNGALTSVLTVSTGREPTFIGKPESIIMDEALAVLGLTKEETIMVGDNYDTDICAGMNAGMDTLLVFTGVTPLAALSQLESPPTYHIQQLQEWITNL
ncbi:4-nitrophenyl phosphatase [Virgibacillus halotolerans]|uniref:TIGR01457 family HAD-type hydrolase n=1 Tax=Virgibacillus halotolerans TaxID=1071053 RepID=UPI00195F67AF|nr:TIGR01457 family HAD-type hydrolase [Virgibacillus halotolerans]MBM7600684.1 4-nitrophenyl phosphatase [Virgibacillus halotolerans]